MKPPTNAGLEVDSTIIPSNHRAKNIIEIVFYFRYNLVNTVQTPVGKTTTNKQNLIWTIGFMAYF